MIQRTFSISNDEIVRGEYFSHSKDPAFTFNPARGLVYINKASLKRLPNMDYALLVISPSEKRLSILPCESGVRDAVRLRSAGQYPDNPRYIRCHRDFAAKMLSLMEWKSNCRYRMIGYPATDGSSEIIAFDLSAAEIFSHEEGSVTVSGQQGGKFGSSLEIQGNDPIVRIAGSNIQVSGTEAESEADNES